MAVCNKQFVVKKVTASFVKVVEPELDMNGTSKSYSVQLIIPKDHPQLPELKNTIKEIVQEAFPGQSLPADCLLLRDSDAEGKGDQYSYMKNTMFCNVRRKEKQGAVPCALPSGELFTPTLQTLFSGCLINCHIGLYDYSVFAPGTNKIVKRGVAGALNGIQLIDNQTVERLGGGAPIPEFGVVEESNVNLAIGPGHAEEDAEIMKKAPVQEADFPW